MMAAVVAVEMSSGGIGAGGMDLAALPVLLRSGGHGITVPAGAKISAECLASSENTSHPFWPISFVRLHPRGGHSLSPPPRGPDHEIRASPSLSKEVWMMDIHLFRIIEAEEREAL